jgi:hypothetical protein
MNSSKEFGPRILTRRMPRLDLGEDLKSLLSTAGLSPKTKLLIEALVSPAIRCPALGRRPQQSSGLSICAVAVLSIPENILRILEHETHKAFYPSKRFIHL